MNRRCSRECMLLVSFLSLAVLRFLEFDLDFAVRVELVDLSNRGRWRFVRTPCLLWPAGGRMAGRLEHPAVDAMPYVKYQLRSEHQCSLSVSALSAPLE